MLTRFVALPMQRAIRLGAFLLIFCVSLLWRSTVEAQQVCYAYDGLGRLTGVIDQNNQAAFYDYDAVGNILSIRRQSPSGPVTIYSFDPPGNAPGGSVEIFGVGFSATPNQNQVTIGSVSATVTSTLPCALVVQVPGNAVSGQISVITPSGQATSTSPFLVSGLVIAGGAAAVLPNGTIQFTAVTNGCGDPTLIWRVNGIVGGNSTVGTIDSTGLYTAPGTLPVPPTVTIRADSAGCVELFAEATVTVVTQFTGFVFAQASANYGSPPAIFPVNTVLNSASVAYGVAPSEAAQGSIISSASVANVPVITAMSPSSAARGANFTITITGVNLAGATDLRFLGASTPDPAITVTNVTAGGPGTTLTANVSILSTATAGTRTVRVDHAVGNSTAGNTKVNIFTITP
jgi:YD repeat-containing protein